MCWQVIAALLKWARKLGKNLTKVFSCIDLSSWEKRTVLLTGVWFEVKNILSFWWEKSVQYFGQI